MVKFQRNFTTSEQSKKLLELGIPADSADCYIDILAVSGDHYGYGICEEDSFDDGYQSIDGFIPCWSTGRLIDIYEYCTDEKFQRESSVCNLMADCIRSIQLAINENRFDLSKLEE